MDTTSLLAAAIGFAPPISLMLWTLQKYTYPRVERPYFSDPTLFGLFAVGIVLGVILHVVSILLPLEYAITGFLIEEAIKLMILNMPRFQRRADIPFYAFGLSAGMASALAFGMVNRALAGAGLEAGAIVVTAIYSVMLALLHTSTGTTIGMGVARGTPWPFFGQAVVVHLATALMLAPSTDTALTGGSVLGVALFIVALVFTAIYYYFVHERLLPQYVKEALVKLGGKKARKVAR